MKSIRSALRTLTLCVCAIWAVSATAQEKTGVKTGFALEPGTVRIVLMRPSVRVGAQSTGGQFEPNADWTAQARENIAAELAKAQGNLGNVVIDYDDSMTEEAALVSQYNSLFGSVASSIIEYQFFPGNRLPTKKKDKDRFEWGMGSGLSQLSSLTDADYLLFINTRDAYGSTGRKMLQFAGMLAGVAVVSGEHAGYAGLVNVKTGELVWLNADNQMGGDVRTPEGASKRVAQLLEGFPGQVKGSGK